MALNLKHKRAEVLAQEVADLTGQSKTAAVILALEEYKKLLLRQRSRQRRLRELREMVQSEVWALPTVVPPSQRSDEEILGFPGGDE